MISKQPGKTQTDFKVERFLDETLLDELANEGFFKQLEVRGK